MKMTPEQLTEKFQEVCGPRLKSVVLHGSAVAGDHIARRSDYNVLVVLDPIDLSDLKELSATIKTWVKAGNSPPHLFTPQELAGAADAFPLEITDIKRSHRILFGQDLVAGLEVHPEGLRLELERELKTKLIQMRQHYLLAEGAGSASPRQLTELMIRSLSGVLVLLRATLLLYRPAAEVPVKKMEALRALAQQIPISTQPFETIEQLKEGRAPAAASAASAAPAAEHLFAEYLKAIEQVVNILDGRNKSHV